MPSERAIIVAVAALLTASPMNAPASAETAPTKSPQGCRTTGTLSATDLRRFIAESGTHESVKTHDGAKAHDSDAKSHEVLKRHDSDGKSHEATKRHDSDGKSHEATKMHDSDLKSHDGAKTHEVDAKSQESNKASDESKKASSEGASKSSSKDKIKKKYRGTPPCLTWIDGELEPKAAILCVHGLGLHNGTYKDFGERMAKLGFAVYSVDVRGFGSWMGAQGHQKVDFDGCLEDVHETLKVIHRVHPKLPVFILGESMGGAIALRATSNYPELIDGLISSVPSGDRFEQGKATFRVALKLLTAPNKKFNVGESVVDQATKKPELKKMWCEDPLARMDLSPKELVQFQNFMNENHDSVKKITATPVLMVQGQKDKLVKPAGTISLFKRIPCQDKDMILITDAEHLIFEEGQFDDHVIEKVNAWLTGHLQKKTEQLTQK